MSDQRESRAERIIVNLRRATTTPPFLPFLSHVRANISLTRQTFNVLYHVVPPLFFPPRGRVTAVTRLIQHAFIFTIILQFILSGVSGITSHLASQVHAVARNAHSITAAVCGLPVPFKGLICAGFEHELSSAFGSNVDHFPAWHPFLINEEVHGPAIDFAIYKAANATSTVLTLVRASDLSQRHEISDKLKDFLQHAWTCELTSGVYLALVKTMVDEMLLENDSIFAKLQTDLQPSLFSRLMMINWAHQAEQAVTEALAIAGHATTTHARRLVAHGDSVYHSLRLLESIALDISTLLLTEVAAVKREKEKIISRVLTVFGVHRGALRVLEDRLADLNDIRDVWREARGLLSLAIRAFNGVRSDIAALSEHRTGPKDARLRVPADQQDQNLKGWVRRLEARRVLNPARVP